MTFEELVESLGIDEPEIIDYNSGAEFGGLTEEQRNYILSEFINGRPVYIMVSQSISGEKSVAPPPSNDTICTDVALVVDSNNGIGLKSMTTNQILGSNIDIILAGSNSSIDDGGSYV